MARARPEDPIPMPFHDLLRLIAQGDPVSPAVANAPLQTLDGNVRYLRDLLDALETSAALFARAVPVEAGALVGMPVYWNAAAARFERGLARAEVSAVAGALLTAESARVWGVVATKHTATSADLVLAGYATVDLSAAVDAPAAAGTYYLSGTTPGRLTPQRPPVSVAVLRADGAGKVCVLPQVVDFLDRHVHYKFALHCAPAGATSPPAPGARHAITAADADLPGWLPADDPAFAGRAPAGAVFGYNLAADPALAAAWPPLPLDNATLEWDQGHDPAVGGTGVPLGPDGLCVLDRYGIWWLSDCYGDVPWPTATDTAAAVSASVSDSVGPECPRTLAMRLTLWFTRLNFATDVTAVTSLRSASPRLLVRCGDGGGAATMGDLVLDLDLDLVVADGVAGYQALKTFDPVTATFGRGPVCEGVYAVSSNVALTGPASRTDLVAGKTVYQGPVGISVTPEATQVVGIELIRLDRVEVQTYQDSSYLGFRAGQASAFRAKLVVPATLALAAPRLALQFRILGRALGTLPALTVTARRLPAPSGAGVAVPLPLSAAEFAVTIDTAAALALGNQYIEATSVPFDVAAGDVIFFTVSRSAGDGYPAEVGLLQQAGILTNGS